MKIRNQLLLNNGMILGVLLVVAATMHQGVSYLVETATWVNHTREVIADARQLAKLTLDIEIAQRGFMHTGKEEYLDPFIAGQKGFYDTIGSVTAKVADNPAQVQRFEKLHRMANEWLENTGDPEIELRHQVDRGEVTAEVLANLMQGLTEDGQPMPTPPSC